MVQDRAIATTANQYNVVYYDLSIGNIFSNFERPATQISRLRQYSVLC